MNKRLDKGWWWRLDVLQRIKDLDVKVDDMITYKKEICDILQVEPKTGHTKIKHMEEIKQYMELEKVKRGTYKVVKIYDTPKERVNNRGNNKTHNDKLIHDITKLFFLVETSQILDIPLDKLDDGQEHDKFHIKKTYYDVFVGIGLCNENSRYLDYFDLLNDERFREYDLDVIYYIMNNFFSERQRILKYNILKDFVSEERIIVFNDTLSRKTYFYEDVELENALDKVLDDYNKEWNKTHKSLKTIPKSQRYNIINEKKKNVDLKDYKTDFKGVIIECHIKSVIEELGLQDLTHDEILQKYESLRKQVNEKCYSHYAQKIHEHFDNMEQIQQALDILEYLVKLSFVPKL